MARAGSGDPSSSDSLPIASLPVLPRILIVEDNDSLRRQLVASFSERDWQVEAARTLHAALEIAAKQMPHVIVSELVLPDARGYFAARYRAAVPGVRIIAVTRMPASLFELARRAGFDEVIAKPANFDELYRYADSARQATHD